MKKKLVLQDFAEAIAKSEGVDIQEAERFLRAFFDVIEQGLDADKYVKIKGLGTFKLVAVSERESVNINTGERFLIGGHTKVSFTPDTALKELVNRPFAHFETVDLSDDTDMEEFETIDRTFDEREEEEEEESEIQPVETPEHEISTPEPAASPVPAEEPLAEEIEDSEETEEAEDANAEETETEILAGSPACVNDPQAAPAAEPEAATAPEIWNIADVTVEEEEENSETTPEETAETTDDAPETVADEPSEEEPVVTVPRSITANSEYEQPAVDYTYTDTHPQRKRNLWKPLAIVLAVVLLMMLSYFAGYYRILCPCSYPYIERLMPVAPPVDTVAPVEKAAPLAKDTTVTTPPAEPADTGRKDNAIGNGSAQETAPASPATEQKAEAGKQAAKAPAKPSPANESASPSTAQPVKPTHHLVGKGDNLYKISRRYYGNDSYVPAIIKLNNLQDADCISQGMRLKLP